MVSNDISPGVVLGFLSAGATGYVCGKAVCGSQLLDDIQRVGSGRIVVSEIPSNTLPTVQSMSGNKQAGTAIGLKDLSLSEPSVLRLLVVGMANKEIAVSLSLCESNVKWHLTRIYPKLGVRSRSEAILILARQEFTTN